MELAMFFTIAGVLGAIGGVINFFFKARKLYKWVKRKCKKKTPAE